MIQKIGSDMGFSVGDMVLDPFTEMETFTIPYIEYNNRVVILSWGSYLSLHKGQMRWDKELRRE